MGETNVFTVWDDRSSIGLNNQRTLAVGMDRQETGSVCPYWQSHLLPRRLTSGMVKAGGTKNHGCKFRAVSK